MVTLSWYEEFIFTAAVSFLSLLQTKVTNTTEKAAISANGFCIG